MPGRPTSTPIPPRMFLMIRCSKVSSSSSAEAVTAGRATRAPQKQASKTRRRLFDCSSRMRSPVLRSKCRVFTTIAAPAGVLANSALHHGGSGRFCGMPPEEGLIQESDHARNDSGIREVKHVPRELEARRGDVEQDEIDYRPIGEPVDGIAQRAADDQAERHGGQPQFGAREPDPEQHHGGKFQREEHISAEVALLREQAVADAGVPGEDEIEKRGEVNDAPVGEIEYVEEPELGGLIQSADDERNGEAVDCKRAPQKLLSSPRRRGPIDTAAAHWSSGVRSLQSGLFSSISRIFQSRFHFFICFSRVIAETGSSNTSTYTSRKTL